MLSGVRLLLICLLVMQSNGKGLKERFQAWKIEQGKQYGSDEEHARRFRIFQENVRWIEEYNTVSGTRRHTVGLGPFSDMTSQEFQAEKQGYHYRGHEGRLFESVSTARAPPSVDWRRHNAVTPVGNEAQCAGACWALPRSVQSKGSMPFGRESFSLCLCRNCWNAMCTLPMDASMEVW